MDREHLARRIVMRASPLVPRPEVPFRGQDAVLYGSQDGCRYSRKPALNTHHVPVERGDTGTTQGRGRPRRILERAIGESENSQKQGLPTPKAVNRLTPLLDPASEKAQAESVVLGNINFDLWQSEYG